ncbi:hypothetical protein [Streptomyces beigongshangae]|uniref:hypothetical protein n=1 Tax=Streptomyces beigongshangae TaxID=2841597 RepID=UPI001C847A7E|nr:hypothetical protein [Streptomyces sp. REN17]
MTANEPAGRPDRRRTGRWAALAATVVLAAAVTTPSAAAGTGQEADAQRICEIRTGVSHTDHTGRTFSTDLYCENAVADVFAGPQNYGTVIAKLATTLSWFVCWETGELHAGGNRIWYYTQGDRILNWPLRKGWGYVPAFSLWTTEDPFPGLPPCVPSLKEKAGPAGRS